MGNEKCQIKDVLRFSVYGFLTSRFDAQNEHFDGFCARIAARWDCSERAIVRIMPFSRAAWRIQEKIAASY